MKRVFYLISFLLINLLLSSCWSSIYTPTTPNIPLFHNRNEFQFESSAFGNGLNLKTAYSPVNHIGLQLNGQFYPFIGDSPGYHNYTEGAIGYYHNINNKFFLELYVGYGEGKFDFYDAFNGSDYDLTLAKGSYFKKYAQIDFGYITHREHTFGSSLRFCYLNCSYLEAPTYPWLVNNSYHNFGFEPYFYFNFRIIKNLSIVHYAGFIIINGENKTIRSNIINGGIGLRLNLGRKITN